MLAASVGSPKITTGDQSAANRSPEESEYADPPHLIVKSEDDSAFESEDDESTSSHQAKGSSSALVTEHLSMEKKAPKHRKMGSKDAIGKYIYPDYPTNLCKFKMLIRFIPGQN